MAQPLAGPSFDRRLSPASNPQYSHFLMRCLPEIRDRIDIDTLQLYLLSEGCVRGNDLPRLKVSADRSLNQVVVDLVLMIKRNGHEDRFLEALRRETSHSGHKELVGILEEEIRKLEELGSAKTAEDDPDSLKLLQTLSPPMYPKLRTDSVDDRTERDGCGDDIEPDAPLTDGGAGNLPTQHSVQGPPPGQPQPPNQDPTVVVQAPLLEPDQEDVRAPQSLDTRPPYSWKPFLIGMVCMGLIAGGLAVIVNGVRGSCTLNERSTSDIHAFNVMFGLLCLSMPVLWLILLIHQILTEYNRFSFVRRLLYGGSLIWFVSCILVAVTELLFSFFVVAPVYENYSEVINRKGNDTVICDKPVYITAFVSVTLIFVTVFVLLLILIFYLVFSIGTASLKKQLRYVVDQIGVRLMEPKP